MPEDQVKLIRVVRFRHVTGSKYHDSRLQILQDEFKNNGKFHDFVINIVLENNKIQSKNLSEKQLDKLAQYVINEIPVFLNGAKYGGLPEHGGKTYTLLAYPGTGLLDELLLNIQNGKRFPELAQKLKITDQIALVEAYVK